MSWQLPPVIAKKVFDRPVSDAGGLSNSTRLLRMHDGTTKPQRLWKWKPVEKETLFPHGRSAPAMLTRRMLKLNDRNLLASRDQINPMNSVSSSLSSSASSSLLTNSAMISSIGSIPPLPRTVPAPLFDDTPRIQAPDTPEGHLDSLFVTQGGSTVGLNSMSTVSTYISSMADERKDRARQLMRENKRLVKRFLAAQNVALCDADALVVAAFIKRERMLHKRTRGFEAKWEEKRLRAENREAQEVRNRIVKGWLWMLAVASSSEMLAHAGQYIHKKRMAATRIQCLVRLKFSQSLFARKKFEVDVKVSSATKNLRCVLTFIINMRARQRRKAAILGRRFFRDHREWFSQGLTVSLSIYTFQRKIKVAQRLCRDFLMCTKARALVLSLLYDRIVAEESKARRGKKVSLTTVNKGKSSKNLLVAGGGGFGADGGPDAHGHRLTKAEREQQHLAEEREALEASRNKVFVELNKKYKKTHVKAVQLIRELQQKQLEQDARAALMDTDLFASHSHSSKGRPNDGNGGGGEPLVMDRRAMVMDRRELAREERRAKLRFIGVFIKQQRKVHSANASAAYKRRCDEVLSSQTTRFDTAQVKKLVDGEASVGEYLALDTDILLSKIPRNPPFMVLVKCARRDPSCAMFLTQVHRQVDRQAHAAMARVQNNIRAQQAGGEGQAGGRVKA